jgi:hypothetical protein
MIVLGDELKVVIIRKKIKNIYFRIDENLNILVSCPKYVSDIEINKLLKDNIKSLERMYKSAVNKSIKDEHIYYLGKKLEYVYYKKVMIDGYIAYGPSTNAVNEYLEKNSLGFFQDRMNIYMQEYDNLPKFRLRIRKMKSRWGVCNKSSMTITLNTLLIHKRVDLIDYVIVHELSHFEHMDHSREFWNCVGRHYPNYKKARMELRD